ncbi:MAG: hypothetical protein A2268_01035 [Candidatus Raymondbacteria bacterium RifOxyA12_full_50_37]|uniref:Uncharacterized protein n=1 Tax=Candidatus Raymondbacteria bacterium RIFOXYD12_FULL_49_13 TaxID=1817890 RepID=A0A1F7FG92_UNCRA|nr:MAG: hypothetical protein A2268_01035 [Candidatus Raymondbacteria bacterium RifOxyA12_full_50_37]OGJ86387.1 MAG: hypothetical protein A2248_14000 [Candidatus Raymondbacteria bacterium RIFOXYA2_FULL_49_16]OGJ95557.1 MAG: hypothetical protein A2453_12775 [Candidatus Raymondbacteria bacterium RIFOXYC2_FULL_50_21]OGJ99454.1 MAG: hypothetical protein A2487_07530 [Candidatus Raymondbacteria bacterium RifOxyC12_full_50_8]OGJ99697.1 MAG: hypothetical protein A2350_07575 [Candidatus Raymondbacteria b
MRFYEARLHGPTPVDDGYGLDPIRTEAAMKIFHQMPGFILSYNPSLPPRRRITAPHFWQPGDPTIIRALTVAPPSRLPAGVVRVIIPSLPYNAKIYNFDTHRLEYTHVDFSIEKCMAYWISRSEWSTCREEYLSVPECNIERAFAVIGITGDGIVAGKGVWLPKFDSQDPAWVDDVLVGGQCIDQVFRPYSEG